MIVLIGQVDLGGLTLLTKEVPRAQVLAGPVAGKEAVPSRRRSARALGAKPGATRQRAFRLAMNLFDLCSSYAEERCLIHAALSVGIG